MIQSTPASTALQAAVSGGYPGSYKKGMEISGVPGADNASGASGANTTDDGTKVFIAGAQDKDGKLLTSGGRVLAASAFAPTFDEAWKKSYELLKSITPLMLPAARNISGFSENK